MSGERYTTPDEDALLRMVRQAGSPEGAAQNLFARLEALEALASQLQAQQEAAAEETGAPAAESDEPQDSEPTSG